jgi:hypothetical protein
METPATACRIIDEEHLRLLAIGHWVVGGLTAVFSLIPIIHLVIGIAMMSGYFPPPIQRNHGPNDLPPEQLLPFMGLLFVIFASLFICLGLTLGGLTLFSASSLGHRQHRTLSFVAACLNCAMIPLGTILGVFTLIVLSRPSVIALYRMKQSAR